MDLAVRAVQMTLSAVLLGMLASVSDDNQRAAPPESGRRAPIEGLVGMSGAYVRYVKRERRPRRLLAVAYVGLSVLAAVTAVVVVIALAR
jgi:hypothetical protein